MVSNVSRVLQRSGAKVYETLVRPGMASTNAICEYYLNVRHRLDPFTVVKPFDPDSWPNNATFSTNKYQHIRPSHIHFEKDEIFKVHDFALYLKNPRVHAALFRSLVGKAAIPDEELQQKSAEFDSALVSTTLAEARSKLESRLPAINGGLEAFIGVFKKLL